MLGKLFRTALRVVGVRTIQRRASFHLLFTPQFYFSRGNYNNVIQKMQVEMNKNDFDSILKEIEGLAE